MGATRWWRRCCALGFIHLERFPRILFRNACVRPDLYDDGTALPPDLGHPGRLAQCTSQTWQGASTKFAVLPMPGIGPGVHSIEGLNSFAGCAVLAVDAKQFVALVEGALATHVFLDTEAAPDMSLRTKLIAPLKQFWVSCRPEATF